MLRLLKKNSELEHETDKQVSALRAELESMSLRCSEAEIWKGRHDKVMEQAETHLTDLLAEKDKSSGFKSEAERLKAANDQLRRDLEESANQMKVLVEGISSLVRKFLRNDEFNQQMEPFRPLQ